MNLNDLFKIETVQQRKEKEEAYYRRMYPFGQQQQQWEESMLKQLFPQIKEKEMPNLKYLLLTYRQALKDQNAQQFKPGEFASEMKFWINQAHHLKLDDKVQKRIQIMGELENNADCLEALPTIQQINEADNEETE